MAPIPPARRLISRDLHAIKVENIPLNVNRREVIALFNTLVGDVRGSSDVMAACGGHLEIYFYSRDAAKKALCMSGYTIAGTALIVTYANNSYEAKEPHQTKPGDTRRNLYVLGLPFDLNKQEFSAIFSQHGTVEHCVILATVDNASRRRGFVVMANHTDAKRAMVALTRTQIRGHTIDISWSIVQRSQGFLDGGDRAVFLEGPAQDSPVSATDAAPSVDTHKIEESLSAFVPSALPSTAIFVSNLPQTLFSEMQDLNPLFCPFGDVEKLEILSKSGKSISVLAQYAYLENAADAKRTLEGQSYLDSVLAIQYAVCPQALEIDNINGSETDRFELYGYQNSLPFGGMDEAAKFDNAYNGYSNVHDFATNTFHSHVYAPPPFGQQRMYLPPSLSRSSSMSSAGSLSSGYTWNTPIPFAMNNSTNVHDAHTLQNSAYL